MMVPLSAFRNNGQEPVDWDLQLALADSGANNQPVRITRPDRADIALQISGPGFKIDFKPSEIRYGSVATWSSRYARQGHLPFGGDLDLFRKRIEGKSSDRESDFVKAINFFTMGFRFPDPDSFTVNAPASIPPERAHNYHAPPDYPSNGDNADLFKFLR